MHAASFKVYHFISLALFGSTFAYPYDSGNLNNLGEEINRNVNEQVAPLQNLGEEITWNVNEQVAPLQNLGEEINRNVNEQVAPLQNLGSRITKSVERQLEPFKEANFYSSVDLQQPIVQTYSQFAGPDLSHLGEQIQQIQQRVYQELQPVRALSSIASMNIGEGGTAIATTHPLEGKKFIIKNLRLYECDGAISDDGKCTGTLSEFKTNDENDDWYYGPVFNIINNYNCVTATTVTVTNGVIECLVSSV